MKKLEKYGVQEICKQDAKDTEGGFFMLFAAAVAVTAIGYAMYDHINS